jgi:hypothetical protein
MIENYSSYGGWYRKFHRAVLRAEKTTPTTSLRGTLRIV